GLVAQNTAANRAALTPKGATVATNGSDNRLLAVALDGALACTPWMAPDLADGGTLVTALPLDELQAARFQQPPVATVPGSDQMRVIAGNPDLTKQNLYRAGVDQAPVPPAQQAERDARDYCQHLLLLGPARIALDRALTSTRPSPDP